MPYLFTQNRLTLELFPPTRICGKSNISHQEWGSLPFFGLSSRILRFVSSQKLREGPLVSRLSWLPWRSSLSETLSSILSQGLSRSCVHPVPTPKISPHPGSTLDVRSPSASVLAVLGNPALFKSVDHFLSAPAVLYNFMLLGAQTFKYKVFF